MKDEEKNKPWVFVLFWAKPKMKSLSSLRKKVHFLNSLDPYKHYFLYNKTLVPRNIT